MQRVSTSATLFLKFFLPTFWIVFFGTFCIAIFFNQHDFYGRIPASTLKIIAALFFILGAGMLYWSVIRLKRVEMDEGFVYVSNYFKNFRYPYHNIEKMEESDYLFFRSMHIHFKKPGNFGKKITFVVSQKLLNDFLAAHPEVVNHLVQKEEKA